MKTKINTSKKNKDSKNNPYSQRKLWISIIITILIGSAISVYLDAVWRNYNDTPNHLLDFFTSSFVGRALLTVTSFIVVILVMQSVFSYIYIKTKQMKKKGGQQSTYDFWGATTFILGFALILFVNIYPSFSIYGYAYQIEKLYIKKNQLCVIDKVERSTTKSRFYFYRRHIFDINTMKRISREEVTKNAKNRVFYEEISKNDSVNIKMSFDQLAKNHLLIATDLQEKVVWELPLHQLTYTIQDKYQNNNPLVEPIFIVYQNYVFLAFKGYILKINSLNGNTEKLIRI